MKKTLLSLALLLVITVVGGYFVLDRPLPVGESGAKADTFASKMLSAINKVAWDTTAVVTWTFKGVHKYVWEKEQKMVEVKWGDRKVHLNLGKWDKSRAYQESEPVTEKEEANELINAAYAYFCNDAYWLSAPFGVFEKDVTRGLVTDEKGNESLLITYNSGGVTPGDTYQWFTDETGLPTHYRMWVAIIPVGGVEATWEDWKKTATGVLLPQSHQLGPINLDMSEVQTGSSLSELGLSPDYFNAIK